MHIHIHIPTYIYTYIKMCVFDCSYPGCDAACRLCCFVVMVCMLCRYCNNLISMSTASPTSCPFALEWWLFCLSKLRALGFHFARSAGAHTFSSLPCGNLAIAAWQFVFVGRVANYICDGHRAQSMRIDN